MDTKQYEMLQTNGILGQTPQNTPQWPRRVETSSSHIDVAPMHIRSALKQRCFNQ